MLDVAMHLVVEGDRSSDIVKKNMQAWSSIYCNIAPYQ